jgi:hypothetical protein
MRFLVPPAPTKALSPLPWQGPSPLPQRHADPMPAPTPGRPLRPCRAGRRPALHLGDGPVRRGPPTGRENALRFLISPEWRPLFPGSAGFSSPAGRRGAFSAPGMGGGRSVQRRRVRAPYAPLQIDFPARQAAGVLFQRPDRGTGACNAAGGVLRMRRVRRLAGGPCATARARSSPQTPQPIRPNAAQTRPGP